nr:hypothetical protein [Rhodoferax sp.]
MLPYLRRTLTITLDTDWFWRRWGANLVAAVLRQSDSVKSSIGPRIRHTGAEVLAFTIRQYGPESRLARTWPTRTMALWVLVLLLGYLVLYYF